MIVHVVLYMCNYVQCCSLKETYDYYHTSTTESLLATKYVNSLNSLFTSLQPGGDAREVYCVCGEGETTRVAKLLPTPQSYEGVIPDKFSEARPIMAVVKKGR